MASCASDGVKLWDLRKLRNFKSLAPYEAAPTTSVSFDFSGLYLAVGGAGGCRRCCVCCRCCWCCWVLPGVDGGKLWESCARVLCHPPSRHPAGWPPAASHATSHCPLAGKHLSLIYSLPPSRPPCSCALLQMLVSTA